MKKRIAINTITVVAVIVFLSCLSCKQSAAPAAPANKSPALIQKTQKQQDIERVLSTYFKGISDADSKDPTLLAKRINVFVNNYCTYETPLESDIRNLMNNCRTSCSGYVYIFREIAKSYGIKSRNVYLFNIPNQGEHSMVEIQYVKDKWALFDPTFGTFFTPHGNPSETPYSLDELYFYCTKNTISRHVVQAKTINPTNINLPIDEIYLPRSFTAPYMPLAAYISAESYGYSDPKLYSMEWMDINMKEGIFQIGGPVKTLEEGTQKFMDITRSLKNKNKYLISFNMSFLGQVGEHAYKNGYRFSHLKTGSIYRITLYGINSSSASIIPRFTDTKAVLKNSGVQVIPKGIYTYSMLFRARDTEAKLILAVYPNDNHFIRIFGIRVETCTE